MAEQFTRISFKQKGAFRKAPPTFSERHNQQKEQHKLAARIDGLIWD